MLKKKEDLICPNAPKITKKPKKQKIPYLNVIDCGDSSSSEEEKEKNEKVLNKVAYKTKDDDRYEDSDDSFNEKETKSQSGKLKESLK